MAGPDSTDRWLTFTPEPTPDTGIGAEESEPTVAEPVPTRGAAEVRPEEPPSLDRPDELAPSTSDALERDTEKTPAVTSEAETAPTPNAETTPTAGGGLVNVGWVDPAIAHAIRRALEPAPRPPESLARWQHVVSLLDQRAGQPSAEQPGGDRPVTELEVSKPAQSSLEVPAPVSPSPQEPTPIALLVEAALVAPATELEPKGWQAERVLWFLRKYYPEGKTSRKKTYKDLCAEFAADPEVIEENKRRTRRDPSPEVMSTCRRCLGYED
jgi:hypothetical protein